MIFVLFDPSTHDQSKKNRPLDPTTRFAVVADLVLHQHTANKQHNNAGNFQFKSAAEPK